MLLEEVYEAVRDLLRAFITDPIARDGHWIFPDYPREDATMPRISVYHTGTARTEIGMGDQGSRFIVTFEIGIWTNSRTTAIIKLDSKSDKKKGSELREYLGDLVMDTFIEKRQYLMDTYGFVDARVVGTTIVPYDPSTDLYNKRILVELTFDVLKA